MVPTTSSPQPTDVLLKNGNATSTQEPGNMDRPFKMISKHPKRTCCISTVIFLFLIIVVIVLEYLVLSAIYGPFGHSGCSLGNTTRCPNDWIGHHGICYHVSREDNSWNVSQKFCTSHGASLLKMSKEEEPAKEFIMRQRGTNSIWIGLRNSNGTWRWMDGEEEKDLPEGNGGACAYLDIEGRATASRCTSLHHSMCSKPAIH